MKHQQLITARKVVVVKKKYQHQVLAMLTRSHSEQIMKNFLKEITKIRYQKKEKKKRRYVIDSKCEKRKIVE